MTATCTTRSQYLAIATSRIFTEIDPKAKEGDFFRIPFLPVVRVVQRIQSGDKVYMIVANSGGERERWIVPLAEKGDRGSGRTQIVAA